MVFITGRVPTWTPLDFSTLGRSFADIGNAIKKHLGLFREKLSAWFAGIEPTPLRDRDREVKSIAEGSLGMEATAADGTSVGEGDSSSQAAPYGGKCIEPSDAAFESSSELTESDRFDEGVPSNHVKKLVREGISAARDVLERYVILPGHAVELSKDSVSSSSDETSASVQAWSPRPVVLLNPVLEIRNKYEHETTSERMDEICDRMASEIKQLDPKLTRQGFEEAIFEIKVKAIFQISHGDAIGTALARAGEFLVAKTPSEWRELDEQIVKTYTAQQHFGPEIVDGNRRLDLLAKIAEKVISNPKKTVRKAVEEVIEALEDEVLEQRDARGNTNRNDGGYFFLREELLKKWKDLNRHVKGILESAAEEFNPKKCTKGAKTVYDYLVKRQIPRRLRNLICDPVEEVLRKLDAVTESRATEVGLRMAAAIAERVVNPNISKEDDVYEIVNEEFDKAFFQLFFGDAAGTAITEILANLGEEERAKQENLFEENSAALQELSERISDNFYRMSPDGLPERQKLALQGEIAKALLQNASGVNDLEHAFNDDNLVKKVKKAFAKLDIKPAAVSAPKPRVEEESETGKLTKSLKSIQRKPKATAQSTHSGKKKVDHAKIRSELEYQSYPIVETAIRNFLGKKVGWDLVYAKEAQEALPRIAAKWLENRDFSELDFKALKNTIKKDLKPELIEIIDQLNEEKPEFTIDDLAARFETQTDAETSSEQSEVYDYYN